MATTTKSKVDPSGRIIEMKSKPDFAFDPAFDSYLVVHENGCDNFTLTLVLKLFFNQVNPTTLSLGRFGTLRLPYQDADKTWFAIKPWTPADFTSFKKDFLRQVSVWSNKFWLAPPAAFADYDYKLGTKTVRPNVYCHLYVDLVSSAAGAHRTIDVVNLDKASAARQLGKSASDLNASDFRSHEGLYDSMDVKPVPLPFDDDKGVTHRLNRSTFAHEVGHALGLPHIGVTHKAPLCQVAILADTLLPESVTSSSSFPAVLGGGSNSNACYGDSGPAKLGANIMGFGMEFDESNAQPWLDRLALHTSTKASDWKVSLKKKLALKIT
jgi:hypothetical protein